MRGIRVGIGVMVTRIETILENRNAITKERRPITEEQYEDSSYTLNTN